jgi:hypothetical protein
MALRLFRAGAAGVALMAAAGAGAQTFVSSGPARPVDLRTAPVLPRPPVPPIDFDRPTPGSGMTAPRAAQQRGASQTKSLPPDTARDRR